MPRINMNLPPGFRFHPSDQELIVHYLKNKVASIPLPASVIAEVELYQYNPWELPTKASFGEDEWYFFTPRDRKYPNGDRPNRAAASGYWKATGTDKPILSSCGTKNIGVKKALVFYNGKPPKGLKTDWIMHEYRLVDSVVWTSKRKGSMRLDDWVLCRVRQRNNTRSTWDDLSCSPYHPHPKGNNGPEAEELHFFNDGPNMELVKNCMENFPLLPYLPDTPYLPFSRKGSSLGIESGAEYANENKMDLPESSLDGIFGLFSDSYESPEFPTTETVSTLSFAQDNCHLNSDTAAGEDVSDANNFIFPETIYSPTSKKLCNRFKATQNGLLLVPEKACESEITFHGMENTELPDSQHDDNQLNFLLSHQGQNELELFGGK